MAFYSRFKLPPLKFTHCPESTARLVHRGVAATRQQQPTEELLPVVTGPTVPDSTAFTNEIPALLGVLLDPSPVIDEPSHHELQSRASVKGWEQLRSQFLSVATECSAMLLGQLCLQCSSPAEFRCQDCGPLVFYCKDCFCSQHEKTNIFHVAEKWDVSNGQPYPQAPFS